MRARRRLVAGSLETPGKGREGGKPAAGAAGKGGGSEGEERDRWQGPDAARRGAFSGGAGPLRAGGRGGPGARNSGSVRCREAVNSRAGGPPADVRGN